MRYVKWSFLTLFWLSIFAFFHYTLPQHDVARITETYNKQVTPGSNALFYSKGDVGNGASARRDVFFIQAFLRNGEPMIYRNEDTGAGWPPYFKFDTTNLQAEATDRISNKQNAEPTWVVIKHYGWRNELYSIFPNAVSVWTVEDPEARIIPWFNIIFLTVLFAVCYAIWVRWVRFREAKIEPIIDGLISRVEDAEEAVGNMANWFRR